MGQSSIGREAVRLFGLDGAEVHIDDVSAGVWRDEGIAWLPVRANCRPGALQLQLQEPFKFRDPSNFKILALGASWKPLNMPLPAPDSSPNSTCLSLEPYHDRIDHPRPRENSVCMRMSVCTDGCV